MQLGIIALRMRQANTSTFGTRVYGAAEFVQARENTLTDYDVAFIIPINETASANDQHVGINQRIVETFAVMVAIRNDTAVKDKLGITAFDRLHNIRTEIFSALLNWQIGNLADPVVDSAVSYAGGNVYDIRRDYLWYQFNFSITSRIDESLGYDNGTSDLEQLRSIYTQWVLMPNAMVPLGNETLPTILIPEAFETICKIDHSYSNDFANAFDTIRKETQTE